MLRRSIPQYDVMRQAVVDLGSRFVRPETHIVDLGCARGDAMAPFVRMFAGANNYVGVDVSSPMLAVARRRFRREIAKGYLQLRPLDLRVDYPPGHASLTLCVLTLQFIPTENRRRILRTVYEHTAPGGALILVEKVRGTGIELSQVMIDLYHRLKAGHGYTAEEIECKRLALEGVLVPVTSKHNEEMLAGAGFDGIDCFWRWMNFAGWIAVKSMRARRAGGRSGRARTESPPEI